MKQILKPMMLRRLKEDVEKNLASKEETIVEVRHLFAFFFLDNIFNLRTVKAKFNDNFGVQNSINSFID